MRLPWNRKYMEIGFHVILTVLLLVGMIALLLRLSVAKNVILQTAGTFLAVFAPVFWAFFFTLLLEPLTAFWQRFYEKRCTLYHRSRIRNRKAGATLTYLSIGLILFLIGGFLARKIGQTNLSALTEQIGDYIRQAGDMLVLLNLKLAEMGILRNAEWIFSRWIEQATRWMQESDSEYRRQSAGRSAWGSGSVLSPDGEGKNSWDCGRIEQGSSGRKNHETRKKSFS